MKVKCDNCNNELRRKPALVKRFKHHFCSIKCKSEWQSQHLVGENNPHYGRHHTEEIRIKISENRKGKGKGRLKLLKITRQELEKLYWGKELSQKEIAELLGVDRRTLCKRMIRWGISHRPAHGPRLERSKRKISEANKGRHHTEEFKKKLSEMMGGANNPSWKGGHEPYYGPNWRKQRSKVLERDNHLCQTCGTPENGRHYSVHHIIPFKEFGRKRYEEANSLENLITLCHLCHLKVENGSVTFDV